ncbi:MAG: bL21 family ribosomal protein, partial [Acetobacteraceae bacterium]|nr:bL21 family ribosomal protein [Elioraea sp.]MCS6932773.1 bL21 family ribosomal protein [Acetobacteraceae bacterium]
MYAVIRASGKQLRVRPGSVVKMDRLDAEPGQTVTFTDVLMVGT